MRRLAKTRKDRERENCELGERLSQRDSQRVQSERERLARRGSEGEEAKEAPLSFSLAAAPPQDPAAPVGQAERPFGVFDLDAAVSRCYGNYDMFQEMTRHLCGEADPLLDQMRAAHAAGNAKKLADTAPPAVRHRAVPRRRARTGSGEVRRSDRPRGRVVGGVGGRRTARRRGGPPQGCVAGSLSEKGLIRVDDRVIMNDNHRRFFLRWIT